MRERGCAGAPIPAPRRQRPGPTLCPYSPKCVEGVFSEVHAKKRAKSLNFLTLFEASKVPPTDVRGAALAAINYYGAGSKKQLSGKSERCPVPVGPGVSRTTHGS